MFALYSLIFRLFKFLIDGFLLMTAVCSICANKKK